MPCGDYSRISGSVLVRAGVDPWGADGCNTCARLDDALPCPELVDRMAGNLDREVVLSIPTGTIGDVSGESEDAEGEAYV